MMKAFAGSLIAALAFLAGCNSSDVAGTSSGVDNPQIIVAFTNSSGTPTTASGTVSLYQADQNPTLNPDAILDTVIHGVASIKLSRSDFTGSADSGDIQYFNVLLVNDSTGGLLQRLAYNPKTREFRSGGPNAVSQTSLKVAPLVRYESKLERMDQGGPERVFIPGTPFQSVVVDSGFDFPKIPPGVFPIRLITNQGKELPLPDSLDTHDMKPHRVDPNAPPVDRPPPPPPPTDLKANAGKDTTVSLGSDIFLSGKVTAFDKNGLVMGIDNNDPRLAVLWRQLSPDPHVTATHANIFKADTLKTKVTFPKPETYRFALSVVYGNDETRGRSEDTVQIVVQSGSPGPTSGSIHPR